MGFGGHILLPERRSIAAAAILACVLVPLRASTHFVLSADGATVYNTANNISWLASADLGATNRFGFPGCDGTVNTKTCVNASGSMSHQAAVAWVTAMNTANYLGTTPGSFPLLRFRDNSCSFVGPKNNSFGWGCSASALASLYNALGFSASAVCRRNPGMHRAFVLRGQRPCSAAK